MTDAPLLLDTCAVIWLGEDEGASLEAVEAVRAAELAGTPIFISPITAWEIGLLVSRGRLNLFMTPSKFFQKMLLAPSIRLAPMVPDVLIASSFLPGSPPRDPADRIIVATAREYGYRIVTRDGHLLAYGEQGHVLALPC